MINHLKILSIFLFLGVFLIPCTVYAAEIQVNISLTSGGAFTSDIRNLFPNDDTQNCLMEISFNIYPSTSGPGTTHGPAPCDEVYANPVIYNWPPGETISSYWTNQIGSFPGVGDYWLSVTTTDGDVYWTQIHYNGTTWSEDPANQATRIDAVIPPDESIVATTTPTEVGATGFVNEADWKSGTRLRIKVDRNTDTQAVGALIAFSAAFGNYTDLSISESGAFDLSTTSINSLLGADRVGLYRVNMRIEAPRYNVLGFNILYDSLVATSTTFTYGTTTAIDKVQLAGEAALAQILEAGGNPLEHCSFDMESILDLTENSNLLSCVMGMIAYVVVPNSGQIGELIEQGRESFFLKAPWGYGVRVYDMVTQPIATSTLPQLAITFPVGPMEGSSIDFTPWDKLAGPGSFIAEYESPYTENNFLDEALTVWNTLCLAIFGFYLIRRLIGDHSVNGGKNNHASV